MELHACIRALEWVAEHGRHLGVQRVQLITDSLYVHKNHKNPTTWRRQRWCNHLGKPIENPDLWKRYISVLSKVSVRVDVLWVKGKKSPILKMVDRAAKAAGKCPSQVDEGFRSGKVGKSKIGGERSSSSLFPASGQTAMIHIYRSQMIRKEHHKVFFDVFDPACEEFTHKCRAYVVEALKGDLHRHHCYRVRFNTEPRYPLIVEVLDELPCKEPIQRIVRDDGPARTTGV
jgi:ribonuclease HI